MSKRRRSSKGIFGSLYRKLILACCITLVLMTVAFGIVTYNMSEQYLINTKQKDMENAIDAVSYLMMQYVKSDEYGDEEKTSLPSSRYYSLRSRLATYHEILNVDVYIADLQGNIMLSFPLLPGTDDDFISDQVYFSEEFADRFLYDGETYTFVNPLQYNTCFKVRNFVVDSGDFHGFYQENEDTHLTISKRIDWYNKKTGYTEVLGAVIMSFPMPELSEARHTVRLFFSIAAVVLVVLEMVILMIFTRRMTKPLKELKKGAEKIAGGNFDLRIARTSNDEIGELVDAFNLAAESLANLDQVRNDFIANVSHELRTPMTSIRGFIEGIMDGVIPPENQRTYLKKVHREICRMNDLVNDLLDWARLAAGKGNLHMQMFDINAVVRTVVSNLETLITEKNIDMDIQFEREKEFVWGDPRAIERVLINLIHNAVKFTPESGKITVKTHRTEKKRVEISVSDTGIGISEQDQNLIFERFYKADKSRSNDKKGTGLGLSIVQKILQNHGQTINVISQPGEGACFLFTLSREEMKDD